MKALKKTYEKRLNKKKLQLEIFLYILFIQAVGLEPTRPKSLGPKSSVSTNFTMPALANVNLNFTLFIPL